MSGRYVSPIPTKAVASYDYKAGDYVPTRTHFFPQANGTALGCKPEHCREHWREAVNYSREDRS